MVLLGSCGYGLLSGMFSVFLAFFASVRLTSLHQGLGQLKTRTRF